MKHHIWVMSGGGRVSLHDKIREDRPSTTITEENLITVRYWRKSVYQEILGHLGIYMCQIQKFLHEQLKLRNLCCRRIPYELTSEQKRNLLKYNRGRLNVAYESVAGNET